MSYNTYPQNPFPPNSENAGGGGSPYVLPIASANTLGGVKVGDNLSIDENGVLKANSTELVVERVQLETTTTISGQFIVEIPIIKSGYTPLGIVGHSMNNRADINITGVYITKNNDVYMGAIVGISTNQSVQPSVDVLFIKESEV